MDLGTDLDATPIGQPNVQNDHIRMQVSRERERLVRRSSLSHDAQVVLCIEEGSETFSDEPVIVRDQDLDLHRPVRECSRRAGRERARGSAQFPGVIVPASLSVLAAPQMGHVPDGGTGPGRPR